MLVMQTLYAGHDKAYKAKKAKGDDGWTDKLTSQRNFARIQSVIPSRFGVRD